MANTVSLYQKYSSLQMAAESFFGLSGAVMDVASLRLGNNRSSRFSATQAQQLLEEGWVLVDHKQNTSTGFSGTLFRNSKSNELVISLRSTEFADDSARDNQATNTLEIKEKGWAFGQIADMEKWYADLQASGKLGATDRFTVTGYSLGGHLATAFYQLREEKGEAGRIASTYTFNGAGVGLVKNGGTLSAAMDDFTAHRGKGSNAASFVTTEGAQRYAELSSKFAAGQGAQASGPGAIKQSVDELTARLEQPIASQATRAELQLLRDALRRMLSIANEAQRVNNGIPNTGGVAAQPVSLAAIEGASLDYQLAVLHAAQNTAPSAGLAGNTFQAVAGRNALTSSCMRKTMMIAIKNIATCPIVTRAQGQLSSKNRKERKAMSALTQACQREANHA
ncbi:hypothetical protein AVKW3434_23725 [Acidovorax sp. SUPP3434]|uniref:hypothetical protein n=1 Tax=Acidovorax sp. SUPP3434 TaxID=2920880 RepID=UPI0023DE1E7C|nr:hypothetical protein [Acidovorax sp. SUPP3434]GKT02456.1 hypothetical protein AVKW3434_23725 [Acidovorax sp. SUPP3434]